MNHKHMVERFRMDSSVSGQGPVSGACVYSNEFSDPTKSGVAGQLLASHEYMFHRVYWICMVCILIVYINKESWVEMKKMTHPNILLICL
jgi:hypothetical protein